MGGASRQQWETTLADLTQKVQAIEQRGLQHESEERAWLRTGWMGMDQAVGGLSRGAIHEWFGWGVERGSSSSKQQRRGSRPSQPGAMREPPSLGVLIHLAAQARTLSASTTICDRRQVVWIGPACWPYGHALMRVVGASGLLREHLFVNPPSDAARLWAMDLALRCPAVAVVIADGSGLDMSATRRLQLAAQAGGTVGLIARPAWEIGELSAAATRWSVEPATTTGDRPTWRVRLLRCKGVRPDSDPSLEQTEVVVEWSREKSDVRLPAELVDQPRQPASPNPGSVPGSPGSITASASATRPDVERRTA